jgi:hypothetical protein
MPNKNLAIAAVALGTLFATAAAAKDVQLKGCTTDGQTATLMAHIDDNWLKTHPQFAKQLKRAFAEHASEMTAEALLSFDGGQAFLHRGMMLDLRFFDHVHFTEDPTITPGCR